VGERTGGKAGLVKASRGKDWFGRGQATMSKDGEGNLQSAKTFVFESFEATFYCIRRKVLMEFNI
jgi:hypothetical protein